MGGDKVAEIQIRSKLYRRKPTKEQRERVRDKEETEAEHVVRAEHVGAGRDSRSKP